MALPMQKQTGRSKQHTCIFFLLFGVVFCHIASTHEHSHDRIHDNHEDDYEAALLKYSKEGNDAAVKADNESPELEAHPYSNEHKTHHGGEHAADKNHDVAGQDDARPVSELFPVKRLWLKAIGAALLVSVSPVFILLLIPLKRGDEHKKLLRILISFASGGLLGDAFFHLIPRAVIRLSVADGVHGDTHAHDLDRSHKSQKHYMWVGLSILLGIVVFLSVEKFVRFMRTELPQEENRSFAADKSLIEQRNSPLEKRKGKSRRRNKKADERQEDDERHNDKKAEKRIEDDKQHRNKKTVNRLEDDEKGRNTKADKRLEDNERHSNKKADKRLEDIEKNRNKKVEKRLEDSKKHSNKKSDKTLEDSERHSNKKVNGRLEVNKRQSNKKANKRLQDNERHSNKKADERLEDDNRQNGKKLKINDVDKVQPFDSNKNNNKPKETSSGTECESKTVIPAPDSVKIAGYMNLAANFTHNFADGLAIGASFLTGQDVGFATSATILLHEIPQEIGDFALLIHSGCSKMKAILLQFIIAFGAVLGTLCSLSTEGTGGAATAWVVPFTAGGFIYIALVSVIPEIIEDAKIWQSLKEILAMMLGVYLMLQVAQH